ncbi:MAG: hypothetical protein IPO71_12890 [Nitrosomonas sp.]|nr:hypothetical protein [Nitrosomonas sp.]
MFNARVISTDGEGATFTVADWFLSQSGNKAEDPLLSGYLPALPDRRRRWAVPQ